MLKIDNLNIEANGNKIIENLSLKIPQGEIHVIMGPNGAGKSTILNAILNNPNYKITAKEMLFDNENILGLEPDEISKRGIFLISQNPTEISGVTNAEMLRMACTARGIKESIFEFNNRLNDACNKLNIDKSFIHHNINEHMSGGEKKKNELLQLYILKPRLILLDELDSGLDIDSLKTLSTNLDIYRKENKASILIITHHTNILEYLTPDKVYVLDGGTIIMDGDIKLANSIEKNGFKGAFSISD